MTIVAATRRRPRKYKQEGERGEAVCDLGDAICGRGDRIVKVGSVVGLSVLFLRVLGLSRGTQFSNDLAKTRKRGLSVGTDKY